MAPAPTIARVGLIIPSSNRMVEQELVPAFPPGICVHVTRLRMTGANHLAFGELLPRIEEATRTLTDARCDTVAFHCTANAMEGGKAGEEQILTTLSRAGAPRGTTTITAIQCAFGALGAKRIALITPYDAATTAHEAAFLRACGYDIVFAEGLALAGSDAYCATPSSFWRERAIAARADADAYLISCANIAVFDVIDELETQLARPVVTSNQAVIYDALRLIGWPDCCGCPGELFKTMPALTPARATGGG
jgi:maleate isomerase